MLVLVDFINPLDFPGAERLLPGALRAARATAALKRKLAEHDVPAIYANDHYGTWHAEFSDVLRTCQSLPGVRGQIARLLAPAPQDLTILKPRHSAFFATPLDLLLREMRAKELVVVGLAADMCVQLTTAEAYMHGYSAWVPSDCTAAESPDAKRRALKHMATVMKCRTQSSVARLAARRSTTPATAGRAVRI
ncbi:isochorismatase family cysteine hydrolase [Pseudorhodoferax sp.]|uniref:isochorismatase family cysteine hydrolase n=1 Tax=Pseudorhodoferax sp. TaxID=1993553 RepID=UPI002DD66D73|nr:isochorismatase family cysteine hydrolase [Pseudorhodoferax sp.]